MSEQQQYDTKRMNRLGRASRDEQVQVMRPSRFFTWHWSVPTFRQGQQWLLDNQAEIRRGQYLSDTPGKEVWRLPIPEYLGGIDILYKFFISTPSFSENFGVHSPVVQEAANFAALRRLEIPVPDVLACGETRRWGRLAGGYIVTKFIPNTVDASILVPGKDWWERSRLRRGFSLKCMEHIGKAHACGCFHSAFHARKILIDRDSPEDNPQLYWLDVSHCQFKPKVSMRKAIALDLVTLFIDLRPTTQEIKEYCAHYLENNRCTSYTVDTLWEAMIAASP
ncbi:MAG TPA: lipopolysaccharide kinase InaA family protein [Lentisphaeria bacterium]|nr:lipopolysaccharide kinase InaA family protein [Lentisphaeria bacterium]